MKVKVGDKVYDCEKEPVMVILSDADKEHIAKMLPEKTRYCAFPEGSDEYSIRMWMEDDGG